MCRNIKTLYNFEPPATPEEIEAAALQFVRKVSGFNKPSAQNLEVFETAVKDVKLAAAKLLDNLQTNAAPKDREVERAKAAARTAKRFGQVEH